MGSYSCYEKSPIFYMVCLIFVHWIWTFSFEWPLLSFPGRVNKREAFPLHETTGQWMTRQNRKATSHLLMQPCNWRKGSWNSWRSNDSWNHEDLLKIGKDTFHATSRAYQGNWKGLGFYFPIWKSWIFCFLSVVERKNGPCKESLPLVNSDFFFKPKWSKVLSITKNDPYFPKKK